MTGGLCKECPVCNGLASPRDPGALVYMASREAMAQHDLTDVLGVGGRVRLTVNGYEDVPPVVAARAQAVLVGGYDGVVVHGACAVPGAPVAWTPRLIVGGAK